MATFRATAATVAADDRWHVIDAEGRVLGRIATVAARLLQGKHKRIYTPFLDAGDHVVVVNAEKVKLSGRKLTDKMYRHHSLYPGGLKEVPAGKLLQTRPVRLVETAVKGMLPKNSLGKSMARKLKVYEGPKHPHEAQQPKPLAIPGAVRG